MVAEVGQDDVEERGEDGAAAEPDHEQRGSQVPAAGRRAEVVDGQPRADHPERDDDHAAVQDLVFPLMSRYLKEMTNGDGDERLEFGLDVLISGLDAVSEKYR